MWRRNHPYPPCHRLQTLTAYVLLRKGGCIHVPSWIRRRRLHPRSLTCCLRLWMRCRLWRVSMLHWSLWRAWMPRLVEKRVREELPGGGTVVRVRLQTRVHKLLEEVGARRAPACRLGAAVGAQRRQDVAHAIPQLPLCELDRLRQRWVPPNTSNVTYHTTNGPDVALGVA